MSIRPVSRVRPSRQLFRGLAAGVVTALALSAWSGAPALAQGAGGAAAPFVSADFREPVTLATKDGVLEVRLTARQGRATLDTVTNPVENFLLFDYEVVRGTASDGKTTGKGLYPAPTLQVFPGEKLIVHLDNALSGLTIADYFSPQYTAKDGAVPTYPIQMTASPLNLHVHGVHVSPKGNSDNVMIHIPAGMSNTYSYDIPTNMPHGAYWYHSHLHTLTAPQVYTGLVGLLSIGRTDGNLPVVTEKNIPVRNMLLQYNFVFDRVGGQAQLNNLNWPQYVSTIVPPKGDELATGQYRPLLAPVNFLQSKPGTNFATVWYSGPLSIRNDRGLFQTIPSNLQRFTAHDGQTAKDVPANPALPDSQRDIQFTVNGQFQPTIRSKAGQTEIWVLANVSDFAYINVQLTETATGRHPPIAIVGQDGNPYAAVQYPPTDDGTRLLIPPASRFAIAVTIPAEGELILEMPPRGGGAKTVTAPGVLYTNDGKGNAPAVLGSLSVQPSAISYADGFFVFPTQVLATATASQGAGITTAFSKGQPLGAYTSFVELSQAVPDVKREIRISGGFLNDKATTSDPKSFVYAFDGAAFPNMPLIQPRLGSVEEWRFINHNNDEHPIHVHVNDFQVTEYYDPTTGLRTGPDQWGVDNANVPAPTMQIDESVIEPGVLTMRTRFDDYDGLFVMHCHRLNHEDNGLMALINVLPAVSSYAVAAPGAAGRPAEVRLFDGNGDRLLAKVTPFPGFEGSVSVVMGDVNGDGVLDLVVGAGKGHAPEVVAYSGKALGGKGAFETELARFQAFAAEAKGGITVASSQIDGTTADNIIVGSGPGAASEVKVFAATLPAAGQSPALFSSFAPYAGDTSGVSLATGFVDFGTGRNSIVTAPGAGSVAEVKVFAFSLLKPIAGSPAGTPAMGHGAMAANAMSSHAMNPSGMNPSAMNSSAMNSSATGHGAMNAPNTMSARPTAGAMEQPANTATFLPFGKSYQGGVSLATGWLAGSFGGAKRIVVSQLADAGTVKVFSSGSALDGGPSMYLHAPTAHDHGAQFTEMASFTPFDGTAGTRVATTSTTVGADLLVSGVSAKDASARIMKYDFVRADPKATTLQASVLGELQAQPGAQAAVLGGD